MARSLPPFCALTVRKLNKMTTASHSFAATKEEGAQPTGGRKPWPPYMYRDDEAAGAKSSTMQLDSELEVLRGFKDEDCQFWERERRRRRQRRRRQQSRGGD